MIKKKEREKAKKQKKWQHEDDQLMRVRANAAQVRDFLRSNGCDLPFYDLMDSYADEFQRTVTDAKRAYSSLVDVHEVDDTVYRQPNWSSLGYGEYRQIFFSTNDAIGDYGSHSRFGKANLCGLATAFRDSADGLRTVIFVRRTVKEVEHKEMKYAMKIIALLHEIGHVHDIEHGLNFDLKNNTANMVEAEVFANLFALEKLAARQLVQSYHMLANALRKASAQPDFLGDVARRVIENLPDHKLVSWQDHLPK